MYQCWLPSPEDRPTFGQIVTDIEEFLADLMNYFDPNSEEPHPDPYVNWQLLQDPKNVEASASCEDKDAFITRTCDTGNMSNISDVLIMSEPVLV